MAYTKQTWADLPNKTTPINANRLTHIEDGIFNAAQTADTAASTAGTAAANVGIVAGRVETLTGRVNDLDTAVSNKVDKVTGKGLSTNDYDDTDKGKVDSLGTASTKNSTSVVTDSTDLVESGAVKELVGWGNKNLLNIFKTMNSSPSGFTINSDGSVTVSTSTTAVTDFIIGNTANGRLLLSDYPSDAIISKGSDISEDNLLLQIWYYDANKSYIINQNEIDGEVKLSPPSNAVYFAIDYRIPVGKTVNTVLHPMISKDGGAYEPYHASVEESKADNSVIGTVEDGTTASQAYAVNDIFIWNGALCKVTSAISQGDTLSNQFTVTNIGAILTALLNA